MVQDSTLDLQFLLFKYGAFILAGLIGSFGTISFTDYNSVKIFAKHLSLAIIFAVVTGILCVNLFNFSLEVGFAISIVVALFAKKITDELSQLIDSLDELGKLFVGKKIDDSSNTSNSGEYNESGNTEEYNESGETTSECNNKNNN